MAKGINNKQAIALIIVFIVGIIWAVGTGVVEVPFAAIPQGKYLGEITAGQTKTITMTVKNTGDKTINNFYYNVQVWGPDIDGNCINNPQWESGWKSTGQSITTGQTKMIQFNLNTDQWVNSANAIGKNYAIIVYPGDSASTATEDIAVKWQGFMGSAYDREYYSSCLSDPASYGCAIECADICCKGGGYRLDVISEATDQYLGRITLTLS